ncbi:hypothetical protein JQ604_15210 [Bradyrhizobium jicamae]|nr:hypothetical protein [Bradyrhizobium jicamae]
MILIDPAARHITEIESTATLAAMHELIGADTLCHFGLARWDDNGQIDSGWMDDGGLSRGEPIHAFLLPRAKDPFAGRCVIVGADRHGETTSCRIPLAVLRSDVSWLGLIKPEVTWDHTEHGSRAIVTYSRVK